MNRRGFLGKICLALAGIAVAPAVNLLAEPETICGGLIWQIQQLGTTATYRPLTYDDLLSVIEMLNRKDYEQPEKPYYVQFGYKIKNDLKFIISDHGC